MNRVLPSFTEVHTFHDFKSTLIEIDKKDKSFLKDFAQKIPHVLSEKLEGKESVLDLMHRLHIVDQNAKCLTLLRFFQKYLPMEKEYALEIRNAETSFWVMKPLAAHFSEVFNKIIHSSMREAQTSVIHLPVETDHLHALRLFMEEENVDALSQLANQNFYDLYVLGHQLVMPDLIEYAREQLMQIFKSSDYTSADLNTLWLFAEERTDFKLKVFVFNRYLYLTDISSVLDSIRASLLTLQDQRDYFHIYCKNNRVIMDVEHVQVSFDLIENEFGIPLHEIYFNGEEKSDEDFEVLKETLPHLKNLKALLIDHKSPLHVNETALDVLKQIATLDKITFAHVRVDGTFLFEYISKNAQLKTLVLSNLNNFPDVFAASQPYVSALHSIENLTVQGCSSDSIDSFIHFLTHLKSLRSLTLERCFFRKKFETLAVQFPEDNQLVELSLQAVIPALINPQESAFLVTLLSKTPHLVKLDLSQQGFKWTGIQHIMPLITNLVHLTHLNLNQAYWQDVNEGSLFINQELKASIKNLGNLLKLTYLNLAYNFKAGAFRDSDLALTLQELKCLRYLNLSYNGMAQEDVLAFSKTLLHLEELEALDLAGNGLSHEGGRALFLALTRLPLKDLRVRECQLNRSVIDAFTSTLAQLKDLEVLDVGNYMIFSQSHNQMKGKEFEKFILSLSHLKKLKFLNLDNLKIGNREALLLADVLSDMHHLESLSLASNQINLEGAYALAYYLNQAGNFCHLNLRGNKELSKEERHVLISSKDLPFVKVEVSFSLF